MTGRIFIVVALLTLLSGLALVWNESARAPEVRLPLHEAEDRATPLSGGDLRSTAESPRQDLSEPVAPEDEARATLEEAPAGKPRPGARPVLLIRGRVLNRNGAPVAGAEITANVTSAEYRPPPQRVTTAELARALRTPTPPTASSPKKPPAKRQPHARSGKDGSFLLRRRAYEKSRLTITARHADFAPARLTEVWNATIPTVQLGDIILDVGGTAVGQIVDRNQRPIEGVEVRFIAAPTPPNPDASARDAAPFTPPDLANSIEGVRTTEDGTFELRHLPAGPFLLYADKSPYLPEVTETLTAQSRVTTTCGRIRLVVGATVTGQVRDPKGRALEGVQVETSVFAAATRDNGRRRRTADPKAKTKAPTPRDLAREGVRRITQTDEDGRFQMHGLPDAELRFAFAHEDYIEEVRGPLDPGKTSQLTITLHPRLVLAGRVVDRSSGRPIESYGITARRVRNSIRTQPTPRPRTKKSERKKPSPKSQRPRRESAKSRAKRLARARAKERARAQKAAKQQAERDAIVSALRRQTAYLQQRLGPTGSAPLSRPRATAHEDGSFRIVGLQPGTYVLDILAPGHVHTAAGPFELVRGQTPRDLTIRLQRGVELTGRVVDRGTGRPISSANLSLELPALTPPTTDNPRVRAKLRSVRTNARVAQARSDRDGTFRISGLRPGVYQLEASARKYRDLIVPNLMVGSRATTQRAVRLERSASVRGTVTSREPGAEYSVQFYGKHGSQSARVDRETGTYSITTLEPDEYHVLVRGGKDYDSRRAKLELAVRRKRGGFDLRSFPGAELRHDIDAKTTVLGTLRGRVFHNGRDAGGFGIQLVPEFQPATKSSSYLLRRTTDDKGSFGFAYLEPGTYTIEVTPPRARSRSRAPWHRERISIPSGSTRDERVDVRTGNLHFTVLDARSGLPVSKARIEMVRVDEVQGRTRKEWRRTPSSRRVTVRDGNVLIRDLMPGAYLYVVSGSGLATEPLRAHVSPGGGNVVVRAAPKPPKKPKPSSSKR